MELFIGLIAGSLIIAAKAAPMSNDFVYQNEIVVDAKLELVKVSNYPCYYVSQSEGLVMTCNNVTAEELQKIFQNEYYPKVFFILYIKYSPNLRRIENFFNGTTFKQVVFFDTAIESVSDDFLIDSEATLESLEFLDSPMRSETFPFHVVSSFPNLTNLMMTNCDLTYIPAMDSTSLERFSFSSSGVTDISALDMSRLPNVMHIDFIGNNILSLPQSPITSPAIMTVQFLSNSISSFRPGDFVLPNRRVDFSFWSNHIADVAPGAFVLPPTADLLDIYLGMQDNQLTVIEEEVFGEILPFVTSLYLRENPLTCGCDLAWIVLKPEYLKKISFDAYCKNGTALDDLNPQYYEDNC